MKTNDIPVKCTRCRHPHMESERDRVRASKSGGIEMWEHLCPRCGCKSYYDQRSQVAWCWASGKIEIGDSMPSPDTGGGGAIAVASGPKSELHLALGVMARLGFERGVLLVPGVPEAPDQAAAGDALAEWLKWCQKGGKRTASRWPGVVWNSAKGGAP